MASRLRRAWAALAFTMLAVLTSIGSYIMLTSARGDRHENIPKGGIAVYANSATARVSLQLAYVGIAPSWLNSTNGSKHQVVLQFTLTDDAQTGQPLQYAVAFHGSAVPSIVENVYRPGEPLGAALQRIEPVATSSKKMVGVHWVNGDVEYLTITTERVSAHEQPVTRLVYVEYIGDAVSYASGPSIVTALPALGRLDTYDYDNYDVPEYIAEYRIEAGLNKSDEQWAQAEVESAEVDFGEIPQAVSVNFASPQMPDSGLARWESAGVLPSPRLITTSEQRRQQSEIYLFGAGVAASVAASLLVAALQAIFPSSRSRRRKDRRRGNNDASPAAPFALKMETSRLRALSRGQDSAHTVPGGVSKSHSLLVVVLLALLLLRRLILNRTTSTR